MPRVIEFPILCFLWLFQHKKAMIALVAIILLLVGLTTCNNMMSKGAPAPTPIPSYQNNAPTATDAPYAVQTNSRVYYAQKVAEDKTKVTLTGYYSYDSKKWVLTQGIMVLDRGLFQPVVYKR